MRKIISSVFILLALLSSNLAYGNDGSYTASVLKAIGIIKANNTVFESADVMGTGVVATSAVGGGKFVASKILRHKASADGASLMFKASGVLLDMTLTLTVAGVIVDYLFTAGPAEAATMTEFYQTPEGLNFFMNNLTEEQQLSEVIHNKELGDMLIEIGGAIKKSKAAVRNLAQ